MCCRSHAPPLLLQTPQNPRAAPQAAKGAGGPTRMEKARIALIQFQVSPPKADIENTVVIKNYAGAFFVVWGGPPARCRWGCALLTLLPIPSAPFP